MKNFIKYFGIFTIISFSVVSVYISMIYRSIPEGTTVKEFFSYTAFFEDRFYDLRMNVTIDETEKDKRIVLADINDESIKKLGSWPIHRSNWAHLVNKLKIYGAKVIAFDVFFSEESLTCDGNNPDDLLKEAVESFHEIPNNRVIIPYNLFTYDTEYFKELPEDLYLFSLNSKGGGSEHDLISKSVSKSIYPIQKLVDAQSSLGFIEVQADRDGIMRHYRALSNIYNQIYVPSYGLIAYQHFSGELDEGVITDESKKTSLNLLTLGEPALEIGGKNLYINETGETKMRWSGGINKFPRVSIYDIISKSEDDPEMHKTFKNNLVFVGASAFGAYDLRHTPVDAMLPGVYFHMNFTKMLLDGNFLKPFSASVKYSWIILFSSVLLLLLIQMRENPILDIASVIVIIGGIYYFDTYYLIPEGYENRLFFCFFAIIGCYSWNTFVHFYMANQDKAFLKNAFGNYISPELIDEMYKNGEAPKLGGDVGVRTAYFTDIQGFSTFSEKLSATQLVELLNEYLTVMTDLLLEEKGTLDKYEGDAIIAFFGAPMPLPDHATRSCLVAHRMQEALLKLRQKWTSEGEKWPVIVHQMRMRIGINSGEIVTGNMGSKSRMNYTMMGDSVNLAARLEESAKQYGIFTHVSKDTVELAGDQFIFRELDTVKVVGKSIPVTTYDLLGIYGESEVYLEELASKFIQGINLYKEQKWDDAIEIFTQTLELEYKRFPELKGVKQNPSEIYISRCEEYKKLPPPPGWDGVYTLTSK